MAQAVESILGSLLTVGIVNVKYGHVAPTQTIELREAGHPLPDANGIRSTQAQLELLLDLQPDDLVLCLLSGGGSALLELPVDGVTLDDLRALTDALLRSGATINEMNALRKHLSRVKGGQLAQLAQPARVVSLILSDVLGSPLDVIASGPTAPDPTTFADALAVLNKYNLRNQISPGIVEHLERGARGDFPDTPKADDPLFARVTNIVLADNAIACAAAAQRAAEFGYQTEIISTRVQGEAKIIAHEFAQRAIETKKHRLTNKPMCLISGGETTVTIRGTGKGGRAQEFALAAALALNKTDGIVILSAGTDGNDGPTDAAGAVVDGNTVPRSQAKALDPASFLANNDSYNFFQALGDLVITGPTNTNVNDLMLALID